MMRLKSIDIVCDVLSFVNNRNTFADGYRRLLVLASWDDKRFLSYCLTVLPYYRLYDGGCYFFAGSIRYFLNSLDRLERVSESLCFGTYIVLTLVGVGFRGVVCRYADILSAIGNGWLQSFGKHATMYRSDNLLLLTLGFSHNIIFRIPAGLYVLCSRKYHSIYIYGYDGSLVREFARNIRMIRWPDPYKGKGIQYLDEEITLRRRRTL